MQHIGLKAAHFLAFALIALGVTACKGEAQSATAGSQSGSSSTSSIYSHNGSYSGAQINNYGADTLTYGGSYEVTNTPSVTGPAVVATHCQSALSGSVNGPGFGIGLGGTIRDENCEIIAQASALNSLAGAKAALHHMAQIPEVCRTLRNTGKIAKASICPGDPKPKAAKSSKSPTRPKQRPAGLAYTKCEKAEGNRVLIKYRGGLDTSAKSAAKSACLASLGY